MSFLLSIIILIIVRFSINKILVRFSGFFVASVLHLFYCINNEYWPNKKIFGQKLLCSFVKYNYTLNNYIFKLLHICLSLLIFNVNSAFNFEHLKLAKETKGKTLLPHLHTCLWAILYWFLYSSNCFSKTDFGSISPFAILKNLHQT